MNAHEDKQVSSAGRKRGVMLVLLGIAVVMYVSIIYKIIHFGA